MSKITVYTCPGCKTSYHTDFDNPHAYACDGCGLVFRTSPEAIDLPIAEIEWPKPENKPSEGKWVVRKATTDQGDPYWIIRRVKKVDFLTHHKDICFSVYSKADAYLMAAAKDMSVLLSGLVTAWTAHDVDEEIIDGICKEAQKVLKKARGGA